MVGWSAACTLPDVKVSPPSKNRGSTIEPDTDAGPDPDTGDSGRAPMPAPAGAGGAGTKPPRADSAGGAGGRSASGGRGGTTAAVGGSAGSAGEPPKTGAPERHWSKPSKLAVTATAGPVGLASRGSDETFMVWGERDSADHTVVWTTHAQASQAWAQPVRVSDADDADWFLEGLTADPSGSALAFVLRSTQDGYSRVIKRFAGEKGWEPVGAPYAMPVFRGAFSTAMDGRGNAYAIWSEVQITSSADDSSFTWSILGQHVSSTGADGPFQLGSSTISTKDLDALEALSRALDNLAQASATAIHPGGSVLGLWGFQNGVVWGSRSGNGTSWQSAVSFEKAAPSGTSAVAGPLSPQVRLDPAGHGLAVWLQNDGTRGNVRARRYVAGTGWNESIFLENTDEQAQHPSLAMDAKGNAVCVWNQSDGNSNAIWFSRYDVDSGWAQAARIEPADGSRNALYPTVALNGEGHGMAVWIESGVGAVYASRYRAGEGWTTSEMISETGVNNSDIHVVTAADGSAVAMWRKQITEAQTEIWTARFE